MDPNDSGIVQLAFGQRWNYGNSAAGICITAKIESGKTIIPRMRNEQS